MRVFDCNSPTNKTRVLILSCIFILNNLSNGGGLIRAEDALKSSPWIAQSTKQLALPKGVKLDNLMTFRNIKISSQSLKVQTNGRVKDASMSDRPQLYVFLRSRGSNMEVAAFVFCQKPTIQKGILGPEGVLTLSAEGTPGEAKHCRVSHILEDIVQWSCPAPNDGADAGDIHLFAVDSSAKLFVEQFFFPADSEQAKSAFDVLYGGEKETRKFTQTGTKTRLRVHVEGGRPGVVYQNYRPHKHGSHGKNGRVLLYSLTP